MPGPITVDDRLVVQCHLCDFTEQGANNADADDIASAHMEAVHPEVED